MIKNTMRSALLLAALGALSSTATAQERSCDPATRPRVTAAVLFDVAREADLGDAAHEHLQSSFRLIDDDALVSYLTTVGERVRPYIPGANPRIRYSLSDASWTQALSFLGGRIYVTRKMAAFVRSEDELAAVLAHEIAHEANRDSAVAVSGQLRALGVSAIADRRDAFDKYNLIIDRAKRGPKGRRDDEDEQEQIAADRLAVHAITRAGYRPQAMAEFWDRLTETRGQTGSWLSDLFGGTRPEMKRLREVLKAQSPLPEACIDRRAVDPAAFGRWQAAIRAYEGVTRKEMLPGLIFRKALEQPLQPAVDHLAFSPDGRLLLAQDDAGINVLSREPFQPLFRIDAPAALPAHFSPDSTAIVFHTPSLRFEKWDVSSQERALVSEIVRVKPCLTTALSPDGAAFACLDEEGALVLLDVATGKEAFRKDSFAPRSADLGALTRNLLSATASLVFSPDGRYLLAAEERDTMSYDLVDKKPISIGGHLDDLLRSGYGAAFLDSGRVAGIEAFSSRLVVVRFPDGKLLSSTPFPRAGRISATSAGDSVLMRPAGSYRAAAIDVSTGKTLAASLASALDVFNDLLVSEIGDGKLDLRRIKAGEKSLRVAATPLLPSPLGTLFASSLSPDSKWLAMSEQFRGAVWNLESGKRVALVRGFAGAYFDASANMLYADFSMFRDQPRVIGKLDLLAAKMADARPVDENAITGQFGSSMLTVRPDDKRRGVLTLEMSDVRSNERLWSRTIEGMPTFIPLADGDIVLAWPTEVAAAQREIARNRLFATRIPTLRRKEGEFLLEVISARTGATTGNVVFDRGDGLSYIKRVHAAGGVLAIEDSLDRVLIYSLADGQLRQRLFARHATLSPSGLQLAAENTPGQIAVYDLSNGKKRLDLTFAHAIASGRFIDDHRILAVTANQVAYLVDVGPGRDE